MRVRKTSDAQMPFVRGRRIQKISISQLLLCQQMQNKKERRRKKRAHKNSSTQLTASHLKKSGQNQKITKNSVKVIKSFSCPLMISGN